MASLFGLKILRVNGRSMTPSIHPDDYVIVRAYGRFRKPCPGDRVVYRNGSQYFVKRIQDLRDDGRYGVSGDGVLSTPAVDLSPVMPNDMIGRVIYVVKAKR